MLLVDGHPVVRFGLATALRDVTEIEGVDEASSLSEARSALRHAPDLVLLGERLPDGDGLDLLPLIRAHSQRTKVLAFLSSSLAGGARRARRLGVAVCLTKESPLSDIRRAVRAVAEGHVPAAPSHVFSDVEDDYHLTARERSVLKQMVYGRTNPEIAQQLAIGTGTVRTHVSRILAKLDARGRTEAVATALRYGIV